MNYQPVKKVKRVCENPKCGSKFTATAGSLKAFCSRKCADHIRNLPFRSPGGNHCGNACGKKLKIKRGRYCSAVCRHQATYIRKLYPSSSLKAIKERLARRRAYARKYAQEHHLVEPYQPNLLKTPYKPL